MKPSRLGNEILADVEMVDGGEVDAAFAALCEEFAIDRKLAIRIEEVITLASALGMDAGFVRGVAFMRDPSAFVLANDGAITGQ